MSEISTASITKSMSKEAVVALSVPFMSKYIEAYYLTFIAYAS